MRYTTNFKPVNILILTIKILFFFKLSNNLMENINKKLLEYNLICKLT